MRQLILAIIIALIAVLFAVQNVEPATVRFLFWTIPEMSMALILLITLIIGLMVGLLFLAPGIYRRNRVIESQKNRINQLEREISSTPGNKPVV